MYAGSKHDVSTHMCKVHAFCVYTCVQGQSMLCLHMCAGSMHAVSPHVCRVHACCVTTCVQGPCMLCLHMCAGSIHPMFAYRAGSHKEEWREEGREVGGEEVSECMYMKWLYSSVHSHLNIHSKDQTGWYLLCVVGVACSMKLALVIGSDTHLHYYTS